MKSYLSDENGCVRPSDFLAGGSNSLPFRVAAHSDEPLFGFVARCAMEDGYHSVSAFTKAYFPDIPFAEIVTGRAHEEIARRAWLDPSVFARATPILDQNVALTLGSERIDRRMLSFGSLSVCRHCLASDAKFACNTTGLQVEPHIRTLWLFRHVRACPSHGTMLEPLRCRPNDPMTWASGGGGSMYLADEEPARASEADILVTSFVAGRLGFASPVKESREIQVLSFADACHLYSEIGLLLSEGPKPVFEAYDTLEHGLSLAAGLNGQPIEKILDRIGQRRIGMSRNAIYGKLLTKIAIKAQTDPRMRLFAKAVLNSAARYACDGQRPVDWLQGHTSADTPRTAQPDFFGYNRELLWDQRAIGWRAVARALSCDVWLARLAVHHMAVNSRKNDVMFIAGSAQTPVVSLAAIDAFRRDFLSFAELSALWGRDSAELHELLLTAGVRRIDDSILPPDHRRLGYYVAFFDRKAAEKVTWRLPQL